MHFLGVDVGGTNCRFEWWPAGGLAGGDGPGVQPAVHGVDAAVRCLDAVLARARSVAEPAGVVCALAGAGDDGVRSSIAAGLVRAGHRFPIAVVGDVLAAAAAGLADGPGVLLMAGTGSFAVARSAAGELVRIGGRGYLLGDQGSAYDLVRRAAAAAVLAADGLGPATVLTAALTEAFAAPSPQRLGAVIQRLEPAAVAKHLPVVVEAALGGDAVASEVIDAGAAALELLATTVARRAGLGPQHGVALGGGLFREPTLTGWVVGRLAAAGVGITRILDDRDPARAAAWLASGVHERREPQTSWVARGAL